MEASSRMYAAATVGVILIVALFRWTPFGLYPSLVAVIAGAAVILVPTRSIGEGLRRISRRTGVDRERWLFALGAFLAFVAVTKRLGAPDVLVGCGTGRRILCPTGYGVGTALVLFGGGALLLAVGFGSKYRAFRRAPASRVPGPDVDRATIEGVLEPAERPLKTPIDGERALWYGYEIAERQPGGPLAGRWLPVASGERSTPCRATIARERRLSVAFESVRLAPTVDDANVRYAERTVRPDDPLPAGIARLERTLADGSDDTRTTARRYREWYVAPDDVVVATGRLASRGHGTDRVLGGDDGPTAVAVGTTAPELRATLRVRTVLWGGVGLAVTLVGLALVGLAIPTV